MTTRVDWKARAHALEARVTELEAEVARLTSRKVGRAPARPETPDAQLIADVCARLSLQREELAERLGVSASLLGRANRIPLAEHHRARLREMLGPARER